ncbi:MAG: efflux RND transporter periplasmic adaptor subunit [Verrucomicrobiota bacterium]
MRANSQKGSLLVKLGVVLLVLAVAGFFAFRNFQGTAFVKAVGRDTAVDAVTGSVIIHADGGMKELKTEAPGKVAMTNIKPGSSFKKGDILVQLDTTELERDVTEAKRLYDDGRERVRLRKEADISLQLAKEQEANATRLYKLGTISTEDMKKAERAVKAVELELTFAKLDEEKAVKDHEAALARYETQRKKMSVPALFDGTVEGANVVEGEIIGSGHHVATIFSRVRIVAAKISEEEFGRLKVGQQANLRLLTYGEQNYESTISELLPSADGSQRFTVYLDVKVDPEMLKPGSTGEVTITVARNANALVIPRRALFNGRNVFVVRNGVVELRELEVGFVALNVVEVRKGVEQGEFVIVENIEQHRPGQRVRVEERK